jgi:hypothetical protein
MNAEVAEAPRRTQRNRPLLGSVRVTTATSAFANPPGLLSKSEDPAF